MPLVVVNHKRDRVLQSMAYKLAQVLPKIVACALDVRENEEAHLMAGDIEVWVRESSLYDVNVKDLEIVIWANHYPERQANLADRKEVILNGVREFLRDYDYNIYGFVWVLLQPAAFGKI